MQSIDPHTHAVDAWMVKFMLNHALPLHDKSEELPQEDLERTQNSDLQRLAERRETTNDAIVSFMNTSNR